MGLRRMDTAVRMCKEKIIPIFPCYFITLFPINLYNCLTNQAGIVYSILQIKKALKFKHFVQGHTARKWEKQNDAQISISNSIVLSVILLGKILRLLVLGPLKSKMEGKEGSGLWCLCLCTHVPSPKMSSPLLFPCRCGDSNVLKKKLYVLEQFQLYRVFAQIVQRVPMYSTLNFLYY